MTLDITKVQYATTVDTFKNVEPHATGTLSVPAGSYAAGTFQSFSTSIPLERDDMTIQILQNFSFRSSRHYITSYVQEFPDGNFGAQTRAYVTGDTLSVTCFVNNRTGSTQSLSAFTIAITAKRFVTPFD